MNNSYYNKNLSLEELVKQLLHRVEKLEEDVTSLKQENGALKMRIDRLILNKNSQDNDYSFSPTTQTIKKIYVGQNSPDYNKVDFTKNSLVGKSAQINNKIASKITMPTNTSSSAAGGIAFVKEYNSIMSKSDNYDSITARENFVQKFKIKNLNCSNTDTLINNPNIEAEFVEDEYGDYWIIQLQGTRYATLPNITDYTEDIHISRGMSQVFKSNYTFGQNYSHIKVIKPAILDNVGGKWRIISKGELDLR